MIANSPAPKSVLRLIDLREILAADLDAWRGLAEHPTEDNIFIDPDFLLPLMRHLPPDLPPLALFAENEQHQLQVAACVQTLNWSRSLPFPHLTEWESPYKFRGGLLVERQSPRTALDQFFAALSESPYRHGLQLSDVACASILGQHQRVSAEEHGFQLARSETWLRGAIDRSQLDSHDLLQHCSKSRRKSLRQARRWLEQTGTVEFRTVHDAADIDRAIAEFLRLEQQGWKSAAGTAIGCRAPDQRFFEEMVQKLAARGKVLFGELLVGGHVIASTCNLITGKTLFAYKIGWDSAFREGSPGVWVELELAHWVLQQLPHIEHFDSCSRPGSYLEALWPHRLQIGRVSYIQSRRARAFMALRSKLRQAKRKIVTSIDEADPLVLLEPLGLA